ncbi:hypothetical protein AGLY_005534 [Aphis glycines]|uniref:Uncharacterized protein n=1 Tax=Aphis glycines TaxID=307491 RepID=A0A6G0TUC9_APHGL|nr:hypothetical protein AGLY_005534 [Aphis glycines]
MPIKLISTCYGFRTLYYSYDNCSNYNVGFVQANRNDSFEGPTKMSTLPNIEFDRQPFLPNTMNCQTNLKGESVHNRIDNCLPIVTTILINFNQVNIMSAVVIRYISITAALKGFGPHNECLLTVTLALDIKFVLKYKLLKMTSTFYSPNKVQKGYTLTTILENYFRKKNKTTIQPKGCNIIEHQLPFRKSRLNSAIDPARSNKKIGIEKENRAQQIRAILPCLISFHNANICSINNFEFSNGKAIIVKVILDFERNDEFIDFAIKKLRIDNLSFRLILLTSFVDSLLFGKRSVHDINRQKMYFYLRLDIFAGNHIWSELKIAFDLLPCNLHEIVLFSNDREQTEYSWNFLKSGILGPDVMPNFSSKTHLNTSS